MGGNFITAKMVRQSVKEKKITKVDHHDCVICGALTHYFISNTKIFYNPNCSCIGYNPGSIRQVSFQDAADFINMQTNEEVRKEIAYRFGIDIEKLSEHN